jgi:hypothetical protein
MTEIKHTTVGDSQLVTDASTDPPICSLCKAERTGCPVLYSLWPYVLDRCAIGGYMRGRGCIYYMYICIGILTHLLRFHSTDTSVNAQAAVEYYRHTFVLVAQKMIELIQSCSIHVVSSCLRDPYFEQW